MTRCQQKASTNLISGVTECGNHEKYWKVESVPMQELPAEMRLPYDALRYCTAPSKQLLPSEPQSKSLTCRSNSRSRDWEMLFPAAHCGNLPGTCQKNLLHVQAYTRKCTHLSFSSLKLEGVTLHAKLHTFEDTAQWPA